MTGFQDTTLIGAPGLIIQEMDLVPKVELASYVEMKPASSELLSKEEPILNSESSCVRETCNKSFFRKFLYVRHTKFHLDKKTFKR